MATLSEVQNFFHSVRLDKDLCKGCINCIKRCPTEAIRVRKGKAKILSDRCIDCGECIRICPHHAKKAVYDDLEILKDFTYTIALPAPSLYGQFNNLDDVNVVLNGLLEMGFDDIFEVARAAEIVSDATRKLMAAGELPRPAISSACPAVLRLIRVRFPQLIGNIVPLLAPVELAARMAKKEAMEKTGLPAEKIGAIFISPCPAKVTAVKMPLSTKKSYIDGVVAIKDVYPPLLAAMKKCAQPEEELSSAGRMGISWGSSGGEASALLNDRYLAADGIENVIKVLENLEDEMFRDLDYVELNACSGGCVGGVLTVENPYIAKAKLKRLRKYLPVSCNHMGQEPFPKWDRKLEYAPVLELDPDVKVAMSKMTEMQAIEERLYGLDCGSCGSPTCRALAEDIVRGYATEDDCIFKLRESMQTLARSIANLGSIIPGAYRSQPEEESEGDSDSWNEAVASGEHGAADD